MVMRRAICHLMLAILSPHETEIKESNASAVSPSATVASSSRRISGPCHIGCKCLRRLIMTVLSISGSEFMRTFIILRRKHCRPAPRPFRTTRTTSPGRLDVPSDNLDDRVTCVENLDYAVYIHCV